MSDLVKKDFEIIGVSYQFKKFAVVVLNLAYQIFWLHYGFLFNCTIELPKLNNIKNQAIDLIKSKQIFYSSIYSLRLVKVEILRTYITNWLIDLSGNLSHSSKSRIAWVVLFYWARLKKHVLWEKRL